ncbi:hypothetical protein AALP_AA1G080200 [Arabis alpina]|uniref:Transmembrane protein n=1 Tax=Arabis alpina TaxID=50452 RepID=A0A087HLU8_ARAAL|nr:hypothetical protein AALP_AA1G080200 [Arabis alpina]
MAERSFSQLPISSSHSGRRMINTRRGLFPISEYWIHAIPVIVFLCFFTLWCFSNSVSVDMSEGEIMSVHRLEKSMAVRNESHVSLAILASSAVSPVSTTNQNLTVHQHKIHNATQPQNATVSETKPKKTKSETKPKTTKSEIKPKKTKSKSKPKLTKSETKPKQPLSG